MKAAGIGCRLRLETLDPDGEYLGPPEGGWPVLQGRLVAAVEGLHEKIWYLCELDVPLPHGWDPTHGMARDRLKGARVRYLLLSPNPSSPRWEGTAEWPRDYIGEMLDAGSRGSVNVRIGAPRHRVPAQITVAMLKAFPFLCSANLYREQGA